MSLEHQDERRLTDQERDRILDLAARLQDQHQATTSLEEVERTAEEAGIDPRFVRQAAAQPGLYGAQAPAEAEEPRGEIGPRVRYGLALFAAGCLPGMPFVQQHVPHFVVLLGIAAVAALGGHALGRRGEKTWIPPALGVVAFFLGVQALGLVLAQGGGFYRYEPSLALFVLVALAAAGGGAWGRRTRRSARLSRTQRPR